MAYGSSTPPPLKFGVGLDHAEKIGRLPKFGMSAKPKSAGSRDTQYVAGFNPRKARYTASIGTNPAVKDAPDLPTPGSASANYKHDSINPGGKFDISEFNT